MYLGKARPILPPCRIGCVTPQHRAADGEIACRFLEDVGGEAVAAVEGATERLAARLGRARITARGRALTPVERELAG